MASQKRWILGMLMATLDASLFGYLSAGEARISRQGVIRTGKCQFRKNKLGTGEGTTPAQGF